MVKSGLNSEKIGYMFYFIITRVSRGVEIFKCRVSHKGAKTQKVDQAPRRMETLGGRNNRKEGAEWRLYDGGLKSTFTIYESK